MLRYDQMVQDALRGVVRAALREVASDGLPGNHHFYITFDTTHPGVSVPGHLRVTYPQEMTIILQHQFFGLEVEDDRFEITLSFNKALERLSVPFDALVSFVDPSVNFGLQLRTQPEEPAAEIDRSSTPEDENGTGSQPPESAEPEGKSADTVVSLDSFRKK